MIKTLSNLLMCMGFAVVSCMAAAAAQPPLKQQADCSAPLISLEGELGTSSEFKDLERIFLKRAKEAVGHKPAPVSNLKSAGVSNKKDPNFIASRNAFKDADYAAISSLAYAVYGSAEYFKAARDTLVSWASTHKPSGHPIDETRLEGLVWAYSLTCSEMDRNDRVLIKRYLNGMAEAKRRWKFGPKTTVNNHRTHQLKMLILLDTVLGNEDELAKDIQMAKHHLATNIDLASGRSIDFNQRKALYYHYYNLEAWLEIELIASCCSKSVENAFWFSADKILTGDVFGEFSGSTAPIDERRAKSGFSYAKAGSKFDVKRSARSTISYATLVAERKELKGEIPAELWKIVDDNKSSRRTIFYNMRRQIWKLS